MSDVSNPKFARLLRNFGVRVLGKTPDDTGLVRVEDFISHEHLNLFVIAGKSIGCIFLQNQPLPEKSKEGFVKLPQERKKFKEIIYVELYPPEFEQLQPELSVLGEIFHEV